MSILVSVNLEFVEAAVMLLGIKPTDEKCPDNR